jgi:hypothetical protein
MADGGIEVELGGGLKTDLASGVILAYRFEQFSVVNSDGEALGDGIGNRLA